MIELLLTCEHGGRRVPPRYSRLFRGHGRLLASHRGYDTGALALARALAAGLRCRLIAATTTRLLVDLNRSERHPALLSAVTRVLPEDTRERLLAEHYRPYRQQVEAAVRQSVNRGAMLVHVAVHSFTPRLAGRTRNAEIGLPYDPQRSAERSFCECWQRELLAGESDLRVRRNYPYRGAADGLTTYLRQVLPRDRYVGIELEVNQRYLCCSAAQRRRRHAAIVESLRRALAAAQAERETENGRKRPDRRMR